MNERCKKLVDIVKETLQSKRLEVPFFVAGGSVADSLRERDFNDIDVYLYNEDDFKLIEKKFTAEKVAVPWEGDFVTLKAEEHTSTCNSFTHITPETHKVQFIRLRFGDPYFIFSNFDLTCCKCAIDHNYNMHFADDYTEHIEIDYDSMCFDVFDRYHKYVNKGYDDDGSSSLKNLIEYCIINRNIMLQPNYDTNFKEMCVNVLIRSLKGLSSSYTQFTHDKVVEHLSEEDQMEIFERMAWVVDTSIKMKHVSIEFALKADKHPNVVAYSTMIKELVKKKLPEVYEKYPEEYI